MQEFYQSQIAKLELHYPWDLFFVPSTVNQDTVNSNPKKSFIIHKI